MAEPHLEDSQTRQSGSSNDKESTLMLDYVCKMVKFEW